MIRPAEKKDASRLAEILIFGKRTAYRPIFCDDVTSFNEMQVLDLALYYRDTPEGLKDVFVYDDGIVKGMMSWKRGECSLGYWNLSELYVDPFFQKQRVGAELMLNFIASAENSGKKGVYLWVLEENENGRNFYDKFGFKPTGDRMLAPGTDKWEIKYVKHFT